MTYHNRTALAEQRAVAYAYGATPSGTTATGWGCHVVLYTSVGEIVETNSGSSPNATLPRANIAAVLGALKTAPTDLPLTIYTNVDYVLNAANGGIDKWVRDRWMNSSGEDIANRDLFERLQLAMDGRDVRFLRCDKNCGGEGEVCARQLAKDAARSRGRRDSRGRIAQSA